MSEVKDTQWYAYWAGVHDAVRHWAEGKSFACPYPTPESVANHLIPLYPCRHWREGWVTFRRGCTACEAEGVKPLTFEEQQANPTCKECGAELETNTLKIGSIEVFCPNEACPLFVQSFWIDR